MTSLSIETRAKLACAYSGLVWGLFWIPLRQLQEAGINDHWAALIFYLIPFTLAAVLVPFRWRSLAQGGLDLQLKAFLPALSLVVYSFAFFHTTVMRAMLLFYLTPVWSALLGRWILGEPITPVRWFSMALGFAGMFVLIGNGLSISAPLNLGDWLAALSGVGWALAAVILRLGKRYHALDLTIVDFVFAAIIAAALFVAFAGSAGPAPQLDLLARILPWLIPGMLAVVATGVYASMWGVPYLNPAVVGLLFMTEISVGSITAALWSGEPFGPRELAGVLLITAAGTAEGVWEVWQKARARAA